jgi:hypothetical protein
VPSCSQGHAIPAGAQSCRVCGEDIRPRCSQGHVSPAGDQFCQACGELLVLAEPPTSDFPALDYSSDSFSEFIARTGSATPPPEPPTEVVHEPSRSYTRPSPAPAHPQEPPPAPAQRQEPPPAPTAPTPSSPKAADSFPRQATVGDDQTDSFARAPSPIRVGASGAARPGAARTAPGRANGGPPGDAVVPELSPADHENGARLGRRPGGAAGVASPTDAVTRGASGDTTAPPSAPGQPAVPPGTAPAPRRRPRVLLTVGIVIVLAAGGTALALALHKHFASNLTAGQPATATGGSATGGSATGGSAPGGSAPASSGPASPPASSPAHTPAAPPTAWSSATPVPGSLLQGATLTGLSCPLPSVCYAIDSAGRVLSDTKPGPWQVDKTDGAGALTAISCATTQFCLALDHSGNAVLLLGGTWGNPVFVDAREGTFTAASCPSSSFCMTTDSGGNAFVYTPGGWHPFTVDSRGHALTSVSCVGPDFCVAVGSGGSSFTYNGSSWSGPVKVGDGLPLVGVSCASQGFCMAVDDRGHAGVLAGGHWKTGEAGITAAAVACPADGFCMATGKDGGAVLYHSGSWARAHPIDGSATIGMLACPSMTGCTAADAKGNVMSYVPASAAG